MRAPFQILAIPYRMVDSRPLFCVFRRAGSGKWQFIAGGGEDSETPLEAARREAFEESGVRSTEWMALESVAHIPAEAIREPHHRHWREDVYVIPEYAFAFACPADACIRLSQEHTACAWLSCAEAARKLKWDSNRTALYELHCRLRAKHRKSADRPSEEPHLIPDPQEHPEAE